MQLKRTRGIGTALARDRHRLVGGLVCWSVVAISPVRAQPPVQVRVTGVVRDGESGATIAGATILAAATHGTVTDGVGRFRLDLPRGVYSLLVLCGDDRGRPTYGWPAQRIDVRRERSLTLRIDAPARACPAKRAGVLPSPFPRAVNPSTTPWCVEATDRPAAGLTLRGIAGTFAVQLVATHGEKAGQRANGAVRLETVSQVSDSAAVPEPPATVGWFTLDLRLVGAPMQAASDTHVATVAVESHVDGDDGTRLPYVSLLLPGMASEPGMLSLDGPSTILHVTECRADGFAGRWWSGAPGTGRPSGYFCVQRR